MSSSFNLKDLLQKEISQRQDPLEQTKALLPEAFKSGMTIKDLREVFNQAGVKVSSQRISKFCIKNKIEFTGRSRTPKKSIDSSANETSSTDSSVNETSSTDSSVNKTSSTESSINKTSSTESSSYGSSTSSSINKKNNAESPLSDDLNPIDDPAFRNTCDY